MSYVRRRSASTQGSCSVIAAKIASGTLAGDGKAGRITRLVNYVLNPETNNATEKCFLWEIMNFASEEPGQALAEMIAVAESASRSRDPINHYVVSWADPHIPSEEQIKDAVGILLDHLDLRDHQVVWGAHRNTDNIHVHVVVNRVHPDTGRVLDLYRDVPKIHQAAKAIAATQDWGLVMDSRYTVDRTAPRDWEPALSQKAIRMEFETGTVSPERYAQTVVPNVIAAARSWDDLHARLAEAGLSYTPQGSGAVIRIGDTAVKASRVSRSASLARLQKTFGPYRSPGAAAPSAANNKHLLGEFLVARDAHRASQSDEKKALGQQQAAARAALKSEFGRRYKAVVSDRSIPWKKRDLMRRLVAAQRAKAMASLIEAHRLERAAFRRRQVRFPRYQDWKLQKNAAQQPPPKPVAVGSADGAASSARGGPPEALDIRGYNVTVSGDEVHYSLAGRWRPSMIDHGRAISIYDANDAAVRAMLQLANTRWGGLTLNQATPELRKRFAEIAKAEHFALYDSSGAALSPAAARQHPAPAHPSPATRRPSSR